MQNTNFHDTMVVITASSDATHFLPQFRWWPLFLPPVGLTRREPSIVLYDLNTEFFFECRFGSRRGFLPPCSPAMPRAHFVVLHSLYFRGIADYPYIILRTGGSRLNVRSGSLWHVYPPETICVRAGINLSNAYYYNAVLWLYSRLVMITLGNLEPARVHCEFTPTTHYYPAA